jgi:hypothetical protein
MGKKARSRITPKYLQAEAGVVLIWSGFTPWIVHNSIDRFCIAPDKLWFTG